jgi:vancomycin resistance protein YoaR
MKGFLSFLISLFAILLIASSALALDLFKRRNLVLPRTLLGDLSLSGASRAEVREKLQERLIAFHKEPFKLAARGEVQEVSLKDLGIVFNESVILNDLPFARDFSNAALVLWSIAGRREMPDIIVERTELLRVIHEKFPNIPKTKNAHFAREGKSLKIIPGESGALPVLEPLIEQLKENITFFEHKPLFIEFQETQPTVSAEDLETHREALLAALPSSLKLFHEKEKWEVDFQKHPEWISFEKKLYEVAPNELKFTITWDPLSFAQFINEFVAHKLEQAPEDVHVSKTPEGKIQFEGRGNEGRALSRERLLTLANQAIAHGEKEVEIPLAVVPPKVEASEELQGLGIRELIAVGHTRFKGSPANRKHNIGIGLAHYNGMLISPGATFSFNENLGPVDDSTGYKKELVIKPEGTIPEFGGGLCQVSSTLYRAAIYAGLPITERAPHSYAVTYYSQIGGHGLDATIYPPSRDLKFTNDTPASLLIQSYVDGDNAYFKFYGASDGRKVELEGPYISNQRNPPSEPLIVPDKKLAPGEKSRWKNLTAVLMRFGIVPSRKTENA